MDKTIDGFRVPRETSRSDMPELISFNHVIEGLLGYAALLGETE